MRKKSCRKFDEKKLKKMDNYSLINFIKLKMKKFIAFLKVHKGVYVNRMFYFYRFNNFF